MYMYKNSLTNYFTLSIMILISIMIMMISNNFLKWSFMEIFSLMFISYLNINNNYKFPSLIYFIISSLSSSLLFYNLMLSFNYWNLIDLNDNMYDHIMQLTMLMKIGLFPFHLWMIFSFPFLSWFHIFIFSSLTKLTPIYLLSTSINFNNFMMFMLITNSMITSILILKESSIKKMFAISSINHSSYLIMLAYLNSLIFLMYFLIYSINYLLIMHLMNFLNLNNKNMIINYFNFKKINFIYVIMIFLYNMFPPFFTFISKWMYFYEMIMINNSIMYLFLMLISSIIISWKFINLSNYQLLSFKMMKKNWFKFPMFNFSNYFLLMISFMLNSFILFFLLIF